MRTREHVEPIYEADIDILSKRWPGIFLYLCVFSSTVGDTSFDSWLCCSARAT